MVIQILKLLENKLRYYNQCKKLKNLVLSKNLIYKHYSTIMELLMDVNLNEQQFHIGQTAVVTVFADNTLGQVDIDYITVEHTKKYQQNQKMYGFQKYNSLILKLELVLKHFKNIKVQLKYN